MGFLLLLAAVDRARRPEYRFSYARITGGTEQIMIRTSREYGCYREGFVDGRSMMATRRQQGSSNPSTNQDSLQILIVTTSNIIFTSKLSKNIYSHDNL